MTKPNETTKLQNYLRLDTLDTDVDKFIDEGYVNYVKRTGGQVNQFYSLSEYEDAGAGNYRETEVVFSKEIFKRVVLTTKLFPIGISPDSIRANLQPHNVDTKNDFYFRGRVHPSTIDRAHSQLSFDGGEFKNVRRQGSVTENVVLSTLMLIGGEFRAPYMQTNAMDRMRANTVRFEGGEFKRALIRVDVLEKIKVGIFSFEEFMYSTKNINDVSELNFKYKSFPQESNKVSVSYINDNTTVVDNTTYLTEGASMRTLSKTSGVIVTPKDNTTSVYYGKATFGMDFYLRELTPDGYLLHSDGVFVRLNKLDPSQLEIGVFDPVAYKWNIFIAPADTIKRDTWQKLVIEQDDNNTKIFTDGLELGGSSEFPFIKTLVNSGKSFSIGNSLDRKNGVVANIDRVYVTKNINAISDSSLIDKTGEVVAVDLEFSGKTLDNNWESVVAPEWYTNPNGEVAYQVMGNPLHSDVIQDTTILPANNYLIEIKAEATRMPTVETPKRVLLTDNQEGGFELSYVSTSSGSKIQFTYDGVTLRSYNNVKSNVAYDIKVYKIKQYIVLSIDGKFDSLVEYRPHTSKADSLDLLPLTVGKHATNSEAFFYGYLYSLRMTNFYRDEGLFNNYYPENVSDIVVLNFEDGYYDEGGEYRQWKGSQSSLITTSSKKFGDNSLRLGASGVATVSVERDPGLDLKEDDFTFEAWLNPTSRPSAGGESIILTNGRDTLVDYTGSLPKLVMLPDGRIAYKNTARQGAEYFITSNTSVPLNQWSHVALTREDGKLHLYINGKREASSLTTPTAIDLSYNGTFIGNSNLPSNTATQYNGYIDSLRLVKGIAIYSGNTYDVPLIPASINIDTSILRLTYEDPSLKVPVQYPYNKVSETGNYMFNEDNRTQYFSYQANRIHLPSVKIDESDYLFGERSYQVTKSRGTSYNPPTAVGVYVQNVNSSMLGPDYINGDYTYKLAFKLLSTNPILMYYGNYEGAWYQLVVRDKKMFVSENGVKISDYASREVEQNTWYTLTVVKKGVQLLCFLGGVLVLNTTLNLSITTIPSNPFNSYQAPYFHFDGKINGLYVHPKSAEYLDTHEIDYTTYFKSTVSPIGGTTSDSLYNTLDAILYDKDFTYISLSELILNQDVVTIGISYTGGITDRVSIRPISQTTAKISVMYKNIDESDTVTLPKRLYKEHILSYIVRDNASTRVYIDGVKVFETTSKPMSDRTINTSGRQFGRNTADMSYFSTNKVLFKGDTAEILGATLYPYLLEQRPPLEVLSQSQYNTIPRGKVLSNVQGVVVDSNSIYKSSAYYKGDSNGLIEMFPKLPSNRVAASLWVWLESYEGVLLESKHVSLSVQPDGKVVGKLSSTVGESLSVTSSISVPLREWIGIRLVYISGTLYLHLNGTPVASEITVNPNFFSTEEANLLIGRGVKGYIDYVKVSRTPDNLNPDWRYNPLDEVVEDSNISVIRPSIKNLDFYYGLTYWYTKNKTTVVTDDSTRALTNTSDEVDTVVYRIDTSRYVFQDKKMWLSFSQQGKASLKVRYLNTIQGVGEFTVGKAELSLTDLDEAQYRYIAENMAIGIDTIELEFSLHKGCKVSEVSVIFEDFVGMMPRSITESVPVDVDATLKEEGDYGYSFRQ